MNKSLLVGIALFLILSQSQSVLGQGMCTADFSERANITIEGGLTLGVGVSVGIISGSATLNINVQTAIRVQSDCTCSRTSTDGPLTLCGCPQQHTVLLVGTLVSDLEVIDEFGFPVQTLEGVQSSLVLSIGERRNIMPGTNDPVCTSTIDQEIRSLNSSLSVNLSLGFGSSKDSKGPKGSVSVAGVEPGGNGFEATARCTGCETRQRGEDVTFIPQIPNPCLQPVNVSAPITVYLDEKGFAQFTVTATDLSGADDIQELGSSLFGSVSGVGIGMSRVRAINKTTKAKTVFVAFNYKQLRPEEITGPGIEIATFKSFARDSCGKSEPITTKLMFFAARSHRPQLALEDISSFPDGSKLYTYRITDSDPNEGFAVSVSKLASFDDCSGSARATVDTRIPETVGQVFVTIAPGFDAKRCGFRLIALDQQGNRASDTITFDVPEQSSPPIAQIAGSTVLVQGAENPFELVVQDADGDVVDCTLNTIQGQAELTSGFGQLLNDGLHMLMTPAFRRAPFFYRADTFDGTGFDDTITADCQDSKGLSDSASIDVHLNALPQAASQSATLDEDTSVGISLNVSDPDGNALSVSVSAPPAHGSASCAGTACSYTPQPDYFGSDGFGYVVEDGFGGTASATVSLTVLPVNDPPQLSGPGGLSVYEGQSNSAQATCSDIDNTPAQLSLSATGLPPGGSFSTTVSGGQKTGTLSVSPGFGAVQHPSTQASFSGTIQCSDGDLSVTQAFSVIVKDVNRAPVAGNDSASTMEGVSVSVGVLANDNDPDGDSLTITQVDSAGNGTTSISGNNVLYTPNAGFSGTDGFGYTVSDGFGGTASASVSVTVSAPPPPPPGGGSGPPPPPPGGGGTGNGTGNNGGGGGGGGGGGSTQITPQNYRPTAVDDVGTTDEDVALVIDVLANDFDEEGDPITLGAVGPANFGTVSANPDDTVTYTPDPDFFGQDTFMYEVCDAGGLCATGTVTVTVNPVNDQPVAVDDAYSTASDTPLSVKASNGVLANDSDPDGDVLSVSNFDATSTQGGTVAVNPDGSFSYTPPSGFTGEDTFTYVSDDGAGGQATATVTVSVM